MCGKCSWERDRDMNGLFFASAVAFPRLPFPTPLPSQRTAGASALGQLSAVDADVETVALQSRAALCASHSTADG